MKKLYIVVSASFIGLNLYGSFDDLEEQAYQRANRIAFYEPSLPTTTVPILSALQEALGEPQLDGCRLDKLVELLEDPSTDVNVVEMDALLIYYAYCQIAYQPYGLNTYHPHGLNIFEALLQRKDLQVDAPVSLWNNETVLGQAVSYAIYNLTRIKDLESDLEKEKKKQSLTKKIVINALLNSRLEYENMREKTEKDLKKEKEEQELRTELLVINALRNAGAKPENMSEETQRDFKKHFNAGLERFDEICTSLNFSDVLYNSLTKERPTYYFEHIPVLHALECDELDRFYTLMGDPKTDVNLQGCDYSLLHYVYRFYCNDPRYDNSDGFNIVKEVLKKSDLDVDKGYLDEYETVLSKVTSMLIYCIENIEEDRYQQKLTEHLWLVDTLLKRGAKPENIRPDVQEEFKEQFNEEIGRLGEICKNLNISLLLENKRTENALQAESSSSMESSSSEIRLHAAAAPEPHSQPNKKKALDDQELVKQDSLKEGKPDTLICSGRFEGEIVVPTPDLWNREVLLRAHLTKLVKVKLMTEIDALRIARDIARNTPEFTATDLANLVKEATIIASKKNLNEVTMQEFQEARDKIMLDKESKTRR